MIDLYNIVVPRIKVYWKKVAYALKLKPADVRKIEDKHSGEPKKCCDQLFESLLEADHGASASPITWLTLLDAITRVEELATAKEEIIKDITKLMK